MHDEDIEDTVIRRPRAPQDDAGQDDLLDDTVIRPRRGSTPSLTTDSRTDSTAVSPEDDTVVRVPRRPDAGPDVAAGAEPRLPSAPSLPRVPAIPAARVPSIRIGDRVVRLDHPVVVGRRPALPRVFRGPAPELVTVRSSSGQVSSSHVLVHAEGDAVVVDDLRSTNGTVVRPAGAAPFRMPSGASNVVLTGTVVEIGDGNVIEVLSPHLRAAPSATDPPPLPTWPSDPPAPGTPRTPRERS